MSPERQQAISYLRAPANGLWRWAEEGTVLIWGDGTTLAFRQEVTEILRWLSRNGLPPFSSIVLLLAACRGRFPRVSQILGEASAQLPLEVGAKAALLFTARKQLALQTEAALAELGKIHKLPSELNSGLTPKCVLAEALFETAKVERYVDGASVLNGLLGPITDRELNGSSSDVIPGGQVSENLLRQLHIVAAGLKPHTVESLALRLRTGLDALPKEFDLELPSAERARRLIEELSRDRELGAVARAARELMAAVRLPRRLSEREELPVGGVSDISNRGPLDRLLLSELAHDDLTLTVRVALNEALYLRREPPMREPPGVLALLLDSGLRVWGIPRVLATAVAIALAACDRQHAQVLAWRAHGKELLPVDLLSRKGLTEHLGELEVAAHCGAALDAFAKSSSPEDQNQSVVITHRDALDDADFRRELAEHPTGFVAAVGPDGRFELHALPLSSRQPVCEADLDLKMILEHAEPAVPLSNPSRSSNLPAFFGLSPCPFLLPFSGRIEHWVSGSDGCRYATLHDRRLIWFRDHRSGGRLLAADLPAGKTAWMAQQGDLVHLVRAGDSRRPTRLISVPLDQVRASRTVDLELGSELLAVHLCQSAILLIRRYDVRVHSLADGSLLARAINPHHWIHGRFLRSGNQFWFPAWSGQHVRFQPLTLPKSVNPDKITLVFERIEEEGPWLVHRDGVVSSATGRFELNFPRADLDFSRVAVSRDGHRLLMRNREGDRSWLYDLREKKFYDLARIPRPELDPPPILPHWNLYRVLEAITPDRDGLLLLGRKGRWRRIGLQEPGGIRIRDLPAADPEGLSGLPFQPFATPAKLGATLQMAEWPNGSRAFLDSRGLLHLKSHDPSLAEVSLVLADGEMAGWTSDGSVCGPVFFFEKLRRSEPEKVFASVREFLRRLA